MVQKRHGRLGNAHEYSFALCSYSISCDFVLVSLLLFWVIIAGVYSIHINSCSCIGRLVNRLPASSLSSYWVAVYTLSFCCFLLGALNYTFLLFLIRFGNGSGGILPYYLLIIDHVCIYKKDDQKGKLSSTLLKTAPYAAGVGCFFFQSSMNSCVRAFGTNRIVKT